MKISLIVAMARNRVIGRDGGMPWHLPADLAHFKRITMDKPVIMGRRTHESIGKPLPGRLNIVVSRNPDYQAGGCVVVNSLENAMLEAAEYDEAMIIGGGHLYREALPDADRIYLTRIAAEVEGDTEFPELDEAHWREISSEKRAADDKNTYELEFVTLERQR